MSWRERLAAVGLTISVVAGVVSGLEMEGRPAWLVGVRPLSFSGRAGCALAVASRAQRRAGRPGQELRGAARRGLDPAGDGPLLDGIPWGDGGA